MAASGLIMYEIMVPFTRAHEDNEFPEWWYSPTRVDIDPNRDDVDPTRPASS